MTAAEREESRDVTRTPPAISVATTSEKTNPEVAIEEKGKK